MGGLFRASTLGNRKKLEVVEDYSSSSTSSDDPEDEVSGYNKVVKQIDKTLCRNMSYGCLGDTAAERDERLLKAFGCEMQDDEDIYSNREIHVHEKKDATQISGVAYLVKPDQEKMVEGKHIVSDPTKIKLLVKKNTFAQYAMARSHTVKMEELVKEKSKEGSNSPSQKPT